MKKWQLGTNFPLFVSRHAVAWWHQECTRVVYCFCGISTIHVPHRWSMGRDWGTHMHVPGSPPVFQSHSSQLPCELSGLPWRPAFFFLPILKGGGHQALQIIPTYKPFCWLPSGVSVSLLPDLGKAGHISSGLPLFREKEQHPTHARSMNAISHALTQRRTPPRPFFWSLWLFCHPNHKRSFL